MYCTYIHKNVQYSVLWSFLDGNLQFVLGWLRVRLVRSTDKLEVFSCVHTLVELSERYVPSRHPAAWRLLELECAGDAGAGAQN